MNDPYAPPKAEIARASLPSLSAKARVTRALLWSQVVVRFGFVLFHLAFPQRTPPSTILAAVIVPVTAAAFCVWMHAAYTRVRSVAPDARFTPNWAVGCWFVPVVNLWLPLIATRELWKLSRGGDRRLDAGRSADFAIWWCGRWVQWLTPVAISALAIAFPNQPNSAQWVAFPGMLITGICAMLGSRIVNQITAMQRELLGVD